MSLTEDQQRAAAEIAYCEQILGRSQTSVLGRVLPSEGLVTWKHYPEPEVFDPVHGAQWYYHCHEDSVERGEHGHFHCFHRPQGRDGPACHLIAIGVDRQSRLTRLFTVNRWVVGGEWFDAETTTAYLANFNVELALPDYLVNRWLTGVISRYEPEIAKLLTERDLTLLKDGRSTGEVFEDRSIEVLSELRVG